MVDAFKLFLEGGNILLLHALDHDHGERTLAEIIEQYVLSLDRVHVLGQIIQYVVIDARADHAEHRRHQQRKAYDQNHPPRFHHGLAKLDHAFDLLRLLPIFRSFYDHQSFHRILYRKLTDSQSFRLKFCVKFRKQ